MDSRSSILPAVIRLLTVRNEWPIMEPTWINPTEFQLNVILSNIADTWPPLDIALSA
jgi:hypothetical protein